MTTDSTAWVPTGPDATADGRWRTRDITVVAVIAVASGVVFWGFGLAWRALEVLHPFQNVLYGVWLLPAILAAYIVRRPGAALFAEIVAAGLSTLLGSQWGPDTLLSGFVQGAAAELVFAFTLYRSYAVPVLAVASLASAVAAWVHDWALYYPTLAFEAIGLIGVLMAISAVVLIPVATLVIARSLRRAGVLEGFPS